MAYSEALADRTRQSFGRRRGLTEKKMFGGIGFLLNGNMCVGVWKTSLIVRLDPARAPALLKQPHVRPFDITGRPMKGWLMVTAEALETDDELTTWIERSVEFVAAMPGK